MPPKKQKLVRDTRSSVALDALGFPGYVALRTGHVMSLKHSVTPKILATAPNSKSGRPMVQMSKDGKPTGRPLARLILTAFCGARSMAWEPHHRNGDVNDCRLTNLRWKLKAIPPRERIIRMIRGLMRRYEIEPADLADGPRRKS